MSTHRWLCAALFVLALVPAAATADEVGAPAPVDLLDGAGEILIPSEWAGVWQVSDSIYDCQGSPLRTETYEQTLCPGRPYSPGFYGVPPEIGYAIPFECDGTISDTDLNVICAALIALGLGGCYVKFDLQVDATRNGNTMEAIKIFNSQIHGPCNPDPVCRIVRSTATRIGPAPKSCGTPVDRASWGSVKVRYR